MTELLPLYSNCGTSQEDFFKRGFANKIYLTAQISSTLQENFAQPCEFRRILTSVSPLNFHILLHKCFDIQLSVIERYDMIVLEFIGN